jgi:hypothetical protein
MGDKVLKALN